VSRKVAWLWLVLAAGVLAGCADRTSQVRAVFLLIGPGAPAAESQASVRAVTHALLGHLSPGDYFAVGRADAPHFGPQNIVARVRLSRRPTVANGQKRLLRHQIDRLLDAPGGPRGDLTGGLLTAVEFLKNSAAPRRVILIAADLGAAGAGAEGGDFPIQVEGCRVLALDGAPPTAAPDDDPPDDPLGFWRRRIVSGGGSWHPFSDPQQLGELLAG
jgi:hypothetical protein